MLDNKISSDELATGQLIKLTWHPDRLCIARHEGQGLFTMVEAHNTRLAAGDTFECHLFIDHEPAYLADWRHDNSVPKAYCIGKRNGIICELGKTDIK